VPGGDGSRDAAVQSLVFEEQHRVAVVEGGQEEAAGVGGGGGGDHLEPGHVAEPGLHVLAVEGPAPRPPPTGGGARPARARPSGSTSWPVVHDLVEAAGDEVGELELDHGVEPVEGEAQGGADGARLDDRGVAHPRSAELGDEAVGHLEHAAVLGDVLTQEHDTLVGPHGRAEAVGDGGHVAHLALIASVGRRNRAAQGMAGARTPATSWSAVDSGAGADRAPATSSSTSGRRAARNEARRPSSHAPARRAPPPT